MLTLPPRPPKDYVIKTFPKIHRSAPEFTPDSEPRVTQTSLGKYCYPVQYEDNETPEKSIESVNIKILNRWVKEDRASWVDKPGVNDFFIHDMYKKYSLAVNPDYDPRYKHKEKIFNRPFLYEPECLEERRLQKLREKCEKEHLEFTNLCEQLEEKANKDKPGLVEVESCQTKPPFWWKDEKTMDADKNNLSDSSSDLPNSFKTTYGCTYLRWQDEPNWFMNETDPCKRRNELLNYKLKQVIEHELSRQKVPKETLHF